MGGTASGDVTSPRGPVLRGGAPAVLARLVLRAPFSARARREIEYCLVAVPVGLAGFLVVVWVLVPSLLVSASVLGTVVGLVGVVLALRLARRFGSLYRRIAARLLGEQVTGPPPFPPADRERHRPARRAAAGRPRLARGRLRPAPGPARVCPVPRAVVLGLRRSRPELPAVVAALPQRGARNHPEAGQGITPAPFGSLVHASDWGGSLLVGLSVRNVSPAANRGDLQTGNWSMTLS